MSYDDNYFQNQIRKSDDKIAWQYGTMLAFARVVRPRPLRVLDAGCGAGLGLRYLAAQGHCAFGSDLIAYPLEKAHEFVPDARLIRSDLNHTLPFADNSFDVILMGEVIEHMEHARAVLDECCRVLDAGGAVVLTTPNLWDIRRLYYPWLGRVWSGYADPTHIQLFTPPQLTRVMREAGLSEVAVRTGFKPMRWISSRQFHFRVRVPWPPLIGNTLLARGHKPTRR